MRRPSGDQLTAEKLTEVVAGRRVIAETRPLDTSTMMTPRFSLRRIRFPSGDQIGLPLRLHDHRSWPSVRSR
jgi:hypothetical protein